MKAHARHVALAVIVALILLAIGTVAAHAQDFSGYSGRSMQKTETQTNGESK